MSLRFPSTVCRLGCILVSAFGSFVFILPNAAIAASLDEQLSPLLQSHRGLVAIAVKHLDSGDSFYHRADEPMPTASLIKFPVMVEAYRQAAAGLVKMNDELTLDQENMVPGSGILTQHFSPGAKLTLRDAIRLMIVYSDNSATNLVLDRIGLAATSQQMERMGMPNTRIHAKVFRRKTSLAPERSKEFGLGSTTARETVRLYELLHHKKLISEDACDQMSDHLLHCDDTTKLARRLPEKTKFPHKSGATSRVRTDAGIIESPGGPIAICVLTRDNEDQRFVRDNRAHELCGELALAVFNHFNSAGSTKESTEPARLQVGDSGRLVEDLQRTLNDRLSPSPNLAIDGDFGPASKAAVVRFQSEHGLSVTGDVTAPMWAALGTLVTADTAVPTPELVNSEELEVAERDRLSGQPYVTCKAWAIGDSETGELLWSYNADKKLDIASTTKLMTAYVVLKHAQSKPAVLREEIVFSQRADLTTGSTAGVRAGERLSVDETLYGLLLPSGNDASVALAEHFGRRVSSAESPTDGEPVEHFVAEMNRAAAVLGMSNTSYQNTHGLTAKSHQSTASDLVKLAHAIWQFEDFRRYAGTRQHGCKLIGHGGYQRNVVWKNTNRLLRIEGYDGMKTGTTTAAGACLVSTAERDGKRRYMVVLGSSSSAGRYADSRNLYRWMWNQP